MKKKINVLWFYIFLVLYLELGYSLFVFKECISINVIIFSVGLSLFFYLINNLYNSKVNKILFILFTSITSIFFLAQTIYFKFYGCMFSSYSLLKGTAQVAGFSEVIFKILKDNWYAVIYFLLPIFLIILLSVQVINYNKKCNKNVITILIVAALMFTYKMIIMYNISSYKEVYKECNNPLLLIKKAGLFTSEFVDIKRYLFGFHEQEIHDKPCKINNKELYNILDIKFGNKNIDKYFLGVCPSNKNKYTGLLSNMNIIFITAESFDVSLINKDITPTLYNLRNDGIVFNNYYQPLYPVSTTDGEYMLLNSLLPKEGVWSFIESINKDMKFSLGNMFNDYNRYSYHNGDYSFYTRDLSMPNIGLPFKGCNRDLDNVMDCSKWPSSDYEMIKGTYKDYIDKSKFIAYYMTVSGHLSYSKNNAMSNNNKNITDKLPYSSEVKGYIGSNYELEKALKFLVDELKNKEILDNTLIVISPDHYPYGLLDKELSEISNNRKDMFEKHHTSLIMYNPKLKGIVVDKYVSSLDVLPTIYNLFDKKYDSRLLIGRDVFSNDEGLVILPNRSWINENGKYNSITNKFTSFNGNSFNYAKEINKKIKGKFYASSSVLDTSYYGEIGYDKD
ncbi:MAG: sulfatase-like hydrolase/transferase [Bacilli bacterium]